MPLLLSDQFFLQTWFRRGSYVLLEGRQTEVWTGSYSSQLVDLALLPSCRDSHPAVPFPASLLGFSTNPIVLDSFQEAARFSLRLSAEVNSPSHDGLFWVKLLKIRRVSLIFLKSHIVLSQKPSY